MRGPSLGRNYRLLWTAATVSNIGDGVVFAALPLLAASLTRDPALVAGVSTAVGLPWLLFPLVSGALVDRWDRRRVMAAADTFRCILYVILGVAVLTDRASMPLLYTIAFCVGTAETLFDNASQAMMPAIVERQRLESANSRLYASELVTNQFIGPPLGAFLFTAAAAAPFLLDGLSFALAAALVVAIRVPVRPRAAERRPLRSEIAEGLRWLWRQRLLRALAVMLGLWNLVSTASFAIIVLYALEELGLSERAYGVFIAAGSVGGLLGTLVASKVSARLGRARALIASVAIASAMFIVPAITSSAVVAAASFVVSGIVSVVWNVITVSLRQSIIPSHLLGRVNSVYRLFGWGTIPLGAAIGGWIARVAGLRAPFWLGAAVTAAMAVVAPAFVNARSVAAATESEGRLEEG